MEILIDTANLGEIENYNVIYNLTGVTCNPTILSREKTGFLKSIKGIRSIIGNEKQLHVQVTSQNCEEMLREAECLTELLGKNTYIKIPVNEEGIKCLKVLVRKGFRTTGTCIFSVEQAILAASVGVDYIAPYYNRMLKLNIDAPQTIMTIANLLPKHNIHTKILAASFKDTEQITEALLAGAHAVTAEPKLYSAMLGNTWVDHAIAGFQTDWDKINGGKRIYEF